MSANLDLLLVVLIDEKQVVRCHSELLSKDHVIGADLKRHRQAEQLSVGVDEMRETTAQLTLKSCFPLKFSICLRA